MYGKRLFKVIRGTVFQDSNNNGVWDTSEQPLKDIGIRLFVVDDYEAQGADQIGILKEREVFRARTNQNGEFRFLVNEGTYSVVLDTETLPLGKGVTEAGRLVSSGEEGRIDFGVRDVALVYLPSSSVRVNIGQHFTLHPEARDKDGNPLKARLGYTSDDERLKFRSNVCRALPGIFRDMRLELIIDAGSFREKAHVEVKVPEVCSLEKIKLAYELGLISEHQKIRFMSLVLSGRGRLPEEYRSWIPNKSGTGAADELRKYMDRADVDPEASEAAGRSLSSTVPKLERTYKSPGGYFNIHYTLSGPDAVASRTRNPVAIPPYIRQTGLAFDQVRAFTCGSRGFREPILEDGKEAYDIYVFDLKGKYGITYSSQVHNDQSRTRTASSYICIDNTYSSRKGFDKSREDCMKVTAAHEFFHAVQYAYNLDADTWWKEASATWNEDEVYTEVNDYVRYVGSYFNSPDRSLDKSSYSGVIFARFISENYGGYTMIKRIWELQASGVNNSIDAIDAGLKESYPGKGIGEAFNEFSAYNINPSQYYSEGSSWKAAAAVQKTYTSYPVPAGQDQLVHLASRYYLFKPEPSSLRQTLKIIIDGADGGKWGFKLQKRDKNNKLYSVTDIASDGKINRAEIVLNSFGEQYDEIFLIPSNLERERDELSYSYEAYIVH